MGEQKVQNAQEQDVKQLLKVRRDKLAELQARGAGSVPPYQI